MELYQFADVSHHKGDLDISKFAAMGHRILISKASDNYHLPDINGRYDFSANRHYDARFVQNFVNARENGLIAGAYHFCRWDRPLPVTNRTAIVEANLANFQDAISRLPQEYQDEVDTAILDMEQSASQLNAAGLNQNIVSNMARDMVELFMENFERVILYSGSWWTDVWLTTATTEWMAERMGVWEPEYLTLVNNYPWNRNHKPSLPKGFLNEYALTADDYIGKMFAWQYTDRGRVDGVDSNIDLNLTAMIKEELFKLFHQDGAVDPPPPPPPGGGEEPTEILAAIAELKQQLTLLQQTDNQILAELQAIKDKVNSL